MKKIKERISHHLSHRISRPISHHFSKYAGEKIKSRIIAGAIIALVLVSAVIYFSNSHGQDSTLILPIDSLDTSSSASSREPSFGQKIGKALFNSKLEVCPDEMVVNEMPGIDRSGGQDTVDAPMRTSYYLLGGKRYEVDEFDTSWVGNNCRVPITSAY